MINKSIKWRAESPKYFSVGQRPTLQQGIAGQAHNDEAPFNSPSGGRLFPSFGGEAYSFGEGGGRGAMTQT